MQMMHGSEWTLKYDEPEVENVALVHSRDNLSSTSWMHFSDGILPDSLTKPGFQNLPLVPWMLYMT